MDHGSRITDHASLITHHGSPLTLDGAMNACIFTLLPDSRRLPLPLGADRKTTFPLDNERPSGLFNLFIHAKNFYSQQNRVNFRNHQLGPADHAKST
jgi:hypothetical protein